MRSDLGLRLGDGRPQVAPAHRKLHRDVASQPFTENDRRTVLLDHVSQLSERHLGTIGRGDQNCADGTQVAPVGLGPAYGEVEVLFALIDLGDGQPADGCLDDSRYVARV